MDVFSILFLCVQVFFIKTAFSQCAGTGLGLGYAPAIAAECELGYGPTVGAEAAYVPGIAPTFGYGYGLAGPAPFSAPTAYAGGPAYRGAGIGDVTVAGEIPVAGNTLFAGQVPILGGVQFGGEVPAGGVVSISGRCGCGCNGPYMY